MISHIRGMKKTPADSWTITGTQNRTTELPGVQTESPHGSTRAFTSFYIIKSRFLRQGGTFSDG
jgi:hypothetical protein